MLNAGAFPPFKLLLIWTTQSHSYRNSRIKSVKSPKKDFYFPLIYTLGDPLTRCRITENNANFFFIRFTPEV
jgi:hypothetical protein